MNLCVCKKVIKLSQQLNLSLIKWQKFSQLAKHFKSRNIPFKGELPLPPLPTVGLGTEQLRLQGKECEVSF